MSRSLLLLSKAIVMIACCFGTARQACAQIPLITASDGGFENATSTLAANGWIGVNATSITWFTGTAAGAATGTKAVFVGSSNTVWTGSSAAVIKHFYRDIAIPAGATSVFLNYKLKMPIIDNTFDFVYVYTNTTAQTPVAGTLPAGTQRAAYTTPALASFTAQPQINLTALAGTTVRLVFTYKTDAASPFANPAVDDITLTYIAAASGCTNTTLFPSASFAAPAPGAGAYTIATNQFQSEYNSMTGAVAGHTFTSTGSIAGTYITVRSGTFNGTLVASGTSPLNWTAAAGGAYFIHYNTNSSCGTASTNMTSTITNTSPVPLAGENCTNAQNLALLTSPYSATTLGYADDISICRTGFGDRIFFISVPNGSTLSIGESTNGYDEWEYVGYGATCPGTTTINCWDNDGLAQTVWTNNTGSAQTVWYIQDGYSGTGTFTLQWSITTPPACAGAPTAPSDGATGIPTAGTTLSWPSVATATGYDVYFGTTTPAPTQVSSNQAGTTYATGALSGATTYYWRIVPRNAAGTATGCANWSFATAVVGCTNATFYPSTPFAAPAPGDATYTITTCQYQSEYNQMTGAVAGNTFISTAGIAGTYITVRAGAVGGTVVADGITPLSWTAAAGGTYFIHYNTNSSCGTASTCMTSTVQNTTSNDLCGNAFNIGSLPYTSAIISNATMTDDVATSTCDGPYKNIWWKVTGICGTMTAITCTGGTNFDNEIAVFTGSCGSFTQVACNDDNGAGCTSNYAGVSWTSTAGTVYYITVGSYYNAGPTGNIQLNVTGGDVTAPSITCPAAQSPCSATMPSYTGLATGVSDNCTATGSIVITQSPAAGSALALGNTTVTLTATDAANNFAQCTFTVSRPDTDGDGTADCDDGCPNDANKIVPGQCGCGVADTDTDGDGTADCIDGCPNDPLKIAAGVCGCGVADTDTDGDATADCIDGCPNDPNKIAPGICGCGTPDTDSDGDGTANCIDGCPNDPLKIAAGVCGCGIADTDTDGDDTADCIDGCPNDPFKIAAGVCGCGIADTDTDSDGTADCIDGCPNDPLKIAAGVCGCGIADIDTDSDGTADCIDGCPNDPNKIAAGICGCGVADTDSDDDGTADCNDGCPSDPNKIAPGICGCGIADTDTDGDGTADCNDGCPTDPNKVAPGVCGCGTPETPDSDGDGSLDCTDGCPFDPNKVTPGQCGCGTPETDTDADGVADCNDSCPTDPEKIAPGVCGCFTPDDDSDGDGLADCIDPCPDSVNNGDTDGDGTADCTDGCPTDPLKQNPGACGCGVVDTDSDGDTYADCVDGCPADPNKSAPGVCGCGSPDIDSDNDGTLNCLDGCPNDPNKLAPGTCGCGNPEPGATCDDGNVNTINDVITGTCACAGTPVSPTYQLALSTDNNGSETSWEVRTLTNNTLMCTGGGYASNSTQTLNCQLPDDCYKLTIFDTGGDGMCCMSGNGGFVLRTATGERIIDAGGQGIFTSSSSVSQGFCVPLSTNKLTPSRCDRENYLPSDFIQAVPNAAVQAQFGIGNQTDDGYWFWFFNPNGGYDRRIFVSHSGANNTFPAGADRCSYLKFTTIVTNPLPQNMLLNVRVRTQVNGAIGAFGPACRFKIDLTNQCPTTQLNPTAGPLLSCGLTGVLLNGSTTIHAVVVSAANKYQFEFTKPGYLRKIAVPTSSLVLQVWGTLPLTYNSTYSVRVRVSFDNGVNYCPFGTTCQLSTAAGPGQSERSLTDPILDENALTIWPNPNAEGRLNLNLNGLGEGTHAVSIDLFDLMGSRVQSELVNVDGENLNTVINLGDGLARGVYLVQVTANEQVYTKRLVIE